ncbi:MAG: hypothetical protein IMZ52_04675 [Actinobacteria bacterium]|nr:hypothetical protein [Actinomycetota bacterium]MBE3114759.1 hypothetical protein [Actinomycetota bacterium]
MRNITHKLWGLNLLLMGISLCSIPIYGRFIGQIGCLIVIGVFLITSTLTTLFLQPYKDKDGKVIHCLMDD